MLFGGALIISRWGVVGWGRKSYLGLVDIESFFSQDFSRSNKHDTFWLVVFTEYFHVLFLWAIAVSDFSPLEIYKNIGLRLSFITFTINSHADNHSYKYIYLLQIFNYTVRYQFLLKNMLSFFIFKFDLRIW